jgi:hypothetical protein
MKNQIGKSNRRAETLLSVYQLIMRNQPAKPVPKRENKFHLGNDVVYTFCPDSSV